jgi:chemotaxis methyl-accepting protein methylase
VRWEQRDLANKAPPPGHWHLILCRNLAIYLRPEVRNDLYRKLSGALAPSGFLMLGRSERIGDPTSLNLEPIAPNVYRSRG